MLESSSRCANPSERAHAWLLLGSIGLRVSACKGAYHHSVNVIKLIQKLRSARQRLPMLADSTLGVRVDASSLVSLRWCVLRIVAAQHPGMLHELIASSGCRLSFSCQLCILAAIIVSEQYKSFASLLQ